MRFVRSLTVSLLSSFSPIQLPIFFTTDGSILFTKKAKGRCPNSLPHEVVLLGQTHVSLLGSKVLLEVQYGLNSAYVERASRTG